MYEFNNDNIFTGYLKQLLHSFNLPKCKVFKNIGNMKKYFGLNEGFGIVKNYKDNKDYIIYLKKNEVIKEEQYIFDKEYRNLTFNVSLFNGIYDTNAHEYLGEYLRFLRDYKNLNLMSMYNCFSDNILTDDEYKYALIPVKYDTVYTIAFESKKCAYYLGFETNIKEIKNKFNEIKSTSNYSFNNPIKIQTGNENIYKESLYKLIIRYPLNNNDNIVVLEGDFLYNNHGVVNNKNKFVKINPNFEEDYTNVDIDKYRSNLQLLNSKNYQPSPFADRLIEYLADMVILPDDKISKNIIDAKYKVFERYGNNGNNDHIKSKLGKLNSKYTNNERLRFIDAYQQKYIKDINKYDISGYVDKDIEAALNDESRTKGEK